LLFYDCKDCLYLTGDLFFLLARYDCDELEDDDELEDEDELDEEDDDEEDDYLRFIFCYCLPPLLR